MENQIDPSQVRTQLDEILAREIRSFIDVDSEAVMMSFNLATISCITLIVEREREIKQYADSPPERFTRESFIKELLDIGLEQDDYLETAIDTSFKNGFISEDATGGLKAEMPAFMMAGFLDSVFPGMQGMNLLAFILQMNEEVNSGRKSIELAKQSFETTLKTRGVSVSQDHAEKRATEMVSGAVKPPVQTKEVSKKLKKENLNRLSQLMKKRRKRSSDYAARVKVTDVFGKGPSKEEIAEQKAEIQAAQEAAQKAADLARQLAEKEEKIKEAEEAAKEAARQLKALEEKELALQAAREEAEQARKKAAELEEKEALMAQREAELKAMEERIRQKEEQAKQLEAEQLKKEAEEAARAASEDDIESRIAAFESELAMPCPLCGKGKIEEKTTEKGKPFFSCTTPDCRFVSWEKPYHFECPLCKNPFLVEMEMNGEKGLKCPRATCTYSQNNLLDPRQNMAQAAASLKPKKKRKVVRRRKRR